MRDFWTEFDHLLKPFVKKLGSFNNYPLMNTYTYDETVDFHFLLPGVEKEDVTVVIEEGKLLVEAKFKPVSNKEALYSHREYNDEEYTLKRTVELPLSKLDTSKTEVSFKSGILVVSFARRSEDKPRRLTIY